MRICDEDLGLCSNPKITELSADDFVSKRLASKPDIIKNNDFVNNIYAKIKADPNPREIVRSIQITDLHIDFYYKEGAANECNFPICCRDNGPELLEVEGASKAGKWGDYKCDIPTRTLKNMFDFIANNQDTLKTSFITWVGDNSAHNVWDNSNEEVYQYTLNITDTLNQSLGKDSKIQIFPAMGNHDTWPVNVQDFTKPNSNYAINRLKEQWLNDGWLTQDEAEVYGRYGYFSKPFSFNSKGKVISLNFQSCNDLDWWLWKEQDRVDPGHQIEWFENELAELEKNDGFAYVIAHIQPQGCLHQFGVRFHALMDRYQHIVRFSTYGHSHSESVHVTRAINTTDPIGFYMGTGSGTTGGYKNPSFTVFDFDKEYMVPVNAHTYYFNLTEANASPDAEPKWMELHDLVKEYGLPDLSPKSMDDFVTNRMYNDKDLEGLYAWNANRRGAPRKPGQLHS